MLTGFDKQFSRTYKMVLAVLWGILSAQLCQKLATFVLADLQAHKEGLLELDALEGLANLGTSGLHPNHCWRDLLKKLPQPGLPKPFKFEVPLKNKVLGFFKRQTCMMLPHEFLAALYHRYPEVWRSSICPGVSVYRYFYKLLCFI